MPLEPPIAALEEATTLLWEWACRLDEPIRARGMLEQLPYVLDDSARRKQLIGITDAMLAPLASDDAYAAAYDTIWEGVVPGDFPDALAREVIEQTGATTPRFLWVLEECRRVGATSAVDFGCGSGILALYLASHGIQTTGLNLTSRCIEPAQQLAERLALPAQFAYGVAEEWDGHADAAIALEIVEHVRDAPRLIRGMNRVAAKACLLTTPYGSTTYGKDTWAEWGRARLDPGQPCIAHVRVFTPERLNALLVSCGAQTGDIRTIETSLAARWLPPGVAA